MMRARCWSAVAAVLLGAGCGSLGDAPTSDDLPNAGVIGWYLLPQKAGTSIREPFVLCDAGGNRSPAVVGVAPDEFRLWFVDGAGGIGSSTSSDGIYDWSAGAPVSLPGTGPWSDVSAAWDGTAFLLAAAAADGSRIELFRSADGSAWTAAATLTAQPDWEGGHIGGPSLLADTAAGGWILFYTADARGAIGRASSADGTVWTRGTAPLFTAADVQGASGWPVLEIGAPAAGLDTSRPGPPVYKLWFDGTGLHGAFPSSVERSIGFAGSFDGLAWETYAGNPVFAEVELKPGSPLAFGDEREPSVVALPGDEYRMYFEAPFEDAVAGTTRPCIAMAISD